MVRKRLINDKTAGVYLVLRRFGYARSISSLLGAALVASEIHIIYSGRVRSYVIDVLVVLALAAIVPSIARRRWSWRTAVAWLAGAVLVGSLGVFALDRARRRRHHPRLAFGW